MKLPATAHQQCPLRTLTFVTTLAVLLALTWWAYHPGLTGDFLFDDFGSLPVLGATGPVDNWPTFWRYVTSGTAGPTGRPIALLTFLIDAHNWPAKPYPFKVTGVVLHLINGALLFWVLLKLGRVIASPRATHDLLSLEVDKHPGGATADPTHPPSERRGTEGDGFGLEQRIPSAPSADPLRAEGGNDHWPIFAALFGAGAWMLHPLLVSTTLYVVQREAMLAATFVLIGTLGWIASRRALMQGHVKRALIGMALSAWGCTLLAVLSKANGALFPLELLLIEWIILSQQSMPTAVAQRWHRRAVIAFLIVPAALVVAYLLYLIPSGMRSAHEIRGWTIGERLLTEPRVVTDYLRLLFIPHAHSTGLFNDQFAISSGWLHPASTLPCIALIAVLIGAGFALRKRHPAIALALLFYFAAQLMESGWIPLELYFEHRNYLPAMLLFWPIGIGLARVREVRWVGLLVGTGILLALAGLTHERATLWGDGFRQAQVWAAINPDSARAQANAALYDLHHGRPRLAAARLRLSLARHPNDIQVPINLISAECQLGAVQPTTWAAADHALEHTRVGGATAFKWFDEALGMAGQHACTGMDYAALQGTLDAGHRNLFWQGQRGQRQNLLHLQGQLDLAEGRPKAALQSFNAALSVLPTPGAALQQAAYLGAHGYPRLGLAQLDYYSNLPAGPKPTFGMPRIHAWVLRKQGWWPKEIAYLRHNLAEAAAKQQSSSTAAGS